MPRPPGQCPDWHDDSSATASQPLKPSWPALFRPSTSTKRRARDGSLADGSRRAVGALKGDVGIKGDRGDLIPSSPLISTSPFSGLRRIHRHPHDGATWMAGTRPAMTIGEVVTRPPGCA